MRPKAVKVFAPASIANLGAGFDVLGIAIHRPGDIVVAKRQAKPGLSFSVQTKYENVPVDVKKNVAAHVALLLLEELKPPFGVEMILHKKMPVSSGLGSSAASSVAAVAAVNALLAKPLPRRELLRFAVEGERLATGSLHADNVAPCLLGGAQLVRSLEPLDVIALPVRNTITWVVVHPHLEVRTGDARDALPKSVEFKSVIRQCGNVAGLIAGLAQGDPDLVGKCTEDVIVEPVRACMVPGFHEVKAAAVQAGALGCTLSGSGPSMFAVTASLAAARVVASKMKKAFATFANVDCDVYISKINPRGATVEIL